MVKTSSMEVKIEPNNEIEGLTRRIQVGKERI